jgi:predicted DNA-binding transcriptional regulator YafY
MEIRCNYRKRVPGKESLTMSKANNMLSILWMLKSGKRVTAQQLAEALEIHIRTVYRYIDALCASGVPILSDAGHNGGYSLLHEFTESPLFFDVNEQKALIHAAIFAEESGYPYVDALKRAVNKLKTYTNEQQLSEINRHLTGFDVISNPSGSSLENVLQELEMSVANSVTLSIIYLKSNALEPAARRLDPYGLVYWQGKWYLIAHCHNRKEIRNFRVDRIQSLSVTDLRFQRPPDFSPRHFLLKAFLTDSDTAGQPISIRIHGKPQTIQDVSDHWYFNYVMVERSADEIHFKADEQAIRTFIPHLLMTYGKSIRVLEPQLLKERMTAIASDLAKYYQSM